jgi:conjugal transfer pilus assembly protein TraI
MLRLKEAGVLFPFGAPGAVGLAQMSERTNTARSEPALFPAPPMPEQVSADSEDTHQRGNWSEGACPAAPAAAEQADCVANNRQADNEQEAACDEAHQWLRTSSDSTAQLLNHLDSLRAAMDDTVQQREGLLWLRYPTWFETADWPAAGAAQSLSDDGLLEPDPRTPMRRVRDHAGQRWLVLNTEVSHHLGLLLDGFATAQVDCALESREDGPAIEPLADETAFDEGATTTGDDMSLIEVILREIGTRRDSGDDRHPQVLDHATLKTLAKQHRLGVYSLRERLLTDPRVTEDAQRRLLVTRG